MSLEEPEPIIILIITCNRREYEARRLKQKHTIDIIKSTPGFEVYYLIGIDKYIDNINEDCVILENYSNGCSALVVPIVECYENIILKVSSGYNYFLNRRFKGILKFDDDTNISSPIVLEYIKYSSDNGIDYLGHTHTITKEINIYHLKRCLKHNYLYSMIEFIKSNLLYFTGFFYYISYRLVFHFRFSEKKFMGEDVVIGDAFSTLPNGKSVLLPEEIKKYVLPQSENISLSKKPLVLSILKGGLGNRIFQVLASISYATTHGYECVLNMNETTNTSCSDHPPYERMFPMLCKIFPSLRIVNIPLTLKNTNTLKIIKQSEDGFSFMEMPQFNFTNGSEAVIVLDGFFQCYKYFENLDILKLFKLDYQMSQKAIISAFGGNRTNMFFLHIRLGDYLKFTYHYVPLELYYQRCISKILESTQSKYPLIRILVMSNKNKCETTFNEIMDKLPKSNRISYEIQSPDDMPDKTLFLMSLCSGGAICANSSLSWLGSLLIKEKYEQDMKILNSLNSNNLITLDKPRIFMPSQWIQYSSKFKPENVSSVYPHWAEKIDCA